MIVSTSNFWMEIDVRAWIISLVHELNEGRLKIIVRTNAQLYSFRRRPAMDSFTGKKKQVTIKSK
jgi:hypothetical protein